MRLGLIVLFAANTLAAPFLVLDEHLPRATLKDNGCNSLRFPGKGMRFTYDYAGKTMSQVAGSTTRTTGLTLTAKVTISQASTCQFTMEVSKAVLSSKNSEQKEFTPAAETKKFANEMEKFDLTFTMDGDNVQSLFPNNNEPTYTLNIKRGILSALQLDVAATKETDVNGICDVVVTKEKGQVVKSKDLSKCEKRGVNEIGIQSSSMQTESSLKPLTSSSSCSYTLDSSKIKKVVCKENHLFRPFSAGFKGQSGALTTTEQSLTLIDEKKVKSQKPVTDAVLTPTSLIYDHTNEESKPASTITTQFERVMARLVDQSGKFAATQTSAQEFTQLVMLLRKMDTKRIDPLWKEYFAKETTKQYLLDAITYCGTPTCVGVMRDVIVDGSVSGEKMNMFLQGIALVGKTSKEMISDVLKIAQGQPSRQAMLTLGTLLSRHCAQNEHECHKGNNPIVKAESFLETSLGQDCSGQDDPEKLETILMALKAIGNAGRPVRAFNTIMNCARTSTHKNLTVAAFDALRRMPCTHENTEFLVSLVSDEDMDPEKRIHAFRAAMRCPEKKMLHKLIHRLEVEPSKQLASYMWSTLSNVMESSDPKNAEARDILIQMTKNKPLKEVNMPMHKFSRAYEKSVHIDTLKSGATAEGNVVFHPEGYLPKSAFFNLTAHVMGVPVHVVEAAVQMDGLETVLADVFGPEGAFPDNTVFQMFNFTLTKEKFEEWTKKRNERDDKDAARRQKRSANSVENKLNEMHKKVDKKTPPPSGSLSFKIMGQEVRVFSYDDIFWAIDTIDNMNVIQLLSTIAKGGHKSFSKSMLFMDMTHSVPTGLGLPLKLKLLGSTVTTVELDGKFDIRNMFWGTPQLSIEGYVKPSAVVEVSGQMGIDSHFINTGVSVNANMFTSQQMKGGIVYKQGQQLKINLDTPEEPTQLFNFSSTPFMFMNEDSQVIEGASRKINPDACMKSQIIGLGLCTSVRVPVAFREYEAPYFPLSGPAHFGAKLIRVDPKLTTYQFLASLSTKGPLTKGVLTFSTPGAEMDRKIGGDMEYTVTGNLHKVVLGTGALGKRSEMALSYHTVTNSMEAEVRSNLLTKSNIIARVALKNQTVSNGRVYSVEAAAEYDWYRFVHETKVMALKNGPTFATSTTYYPGQTAGFSVDYNKLTKKVTARVEVNQIKQAVEISGQYIAKGAEKGVQLVAAHLTSGKQVTVYTGFVNSKKEKRLVFNVDAMGKTADGSVGISTGKGLSSMKMEATVMGQKAKIFANMNSAEGQRMVIGAKVGKYSAGMETAFNNMHNHGKSLCSSAYYAVGAKRTEPLLACIKTEKMNDNHMKLTASMDMLTLKKTMKVFVDVENHAGQMAINTKSFYNGNLQLWNTIDATYGDYMNKNAEVKVIMGYADKHTGLRFFSNNNADITIGVEGHYLDKKITIEDEINWSKPGQISMTLRSLLNGQLKLWTEAEMTYGNITTGNGEMKMTLGYESKTMGMTVYSKDGADLEFGVEGHFLEKTLALINTLTWTRGNQTTLRTNVILNGNTLPVSTTYRYFYGAEYGVESTVTISKYTMVYKAGARMEGDRRILRGSFAFLSAGLRKIELYQNTILVWTANTKSIEQKFGVLTSNAQRYQYGYQISFTDRSTMAKSAYALRYVLNYSTRRSSSITITFANSELATEMVADVEYVPGKYMSHIVTYSKEIRQLDVTIEFLPKMFVKFMTRLDKNNGYQMTSDVTAEWKNFKQSLQWVNAYTKTKKNTNLSASVGSFFAVAFELVHEKKQPQMAIATLRVMEQEGRLIGTYMPNKNTVLFRALFNNKEKVGITASYNTKGGFDMKLQFTAVGNELSLGADFVEATNRVTAGIEFNKKQLVSLVGQYKKKADAVIFKIKNNQKTVMEVVASRDIAQNAVFLKFNALTIQKSVGFAAKVNQFTKSLTLSAEYESHLIGTTLRADWINMVLSQHVFYNDNIVGWQAHVDVEQKLAAFNITLTPTLSTQVLFEVIEDKIVKMTVQRKFGNQVVDEASIKYTLTPKMWKVAMSWNKDTVNKIKKVVIDALKIATSELKVLSEKATTYGKDTIDQTRAMTMEAIKEYSVKMMELLNNLDKSFDEIDFIAVRNQVGDLVLSALKKLAATTHKGLLVTAESLDAIKKNLPEIMAKTKELVKTLRGDLAKNIDLLVKNIDLISKNVDDVSVIIMKVAKNLTESSRPVINKAIALAKNFTIRGKPASEIYAMALEQAKEILIKYYKKAVVELKALQLKGTKYILNMKVPGRNETVDEMIKLIVTKAKELDFSKMLDDVKTQINTYKVNGKTIMEHIEVLKTEIKKLPQATRVALKKLVTLIRKYKKTLDVTIKDLQKELNAYKKTADMIVGEVQKFSQPMTDYVRLVSRSVEKHFGPLYKKAMKGISKSVDGMDLSMVTLPDIPAVIPVVMKTLDKSINFSTPLVKPILGLIMNITEQVTALDIFETPIVPTLEVAVEKITEKLAAIMKSQAIKMNEAMEKITNYVEKVVKMTPEEFIDMAFDNAESMSVDAVKDAKTMFVKYQLKLKVQYQEAKKLYATISKYFDTLAKRPIGELLETSFANSGLVIISVSDTLANFARQLAQLNIAEPTLAAWEEIDVMGKLRAYGVNDKLMTLINKAKAVNATESVMTLAKDLENIASEMYDMAFLRAIVLYNKVDNAAELVMDYIKSIPKKDYDTWYAELKKLATTNADTVIDYLQRAYGISKTRAARFVKMAKKLYEANYDDLYRNVFVPSRKWIKLISEKADLVYEDIKEPTIAVTKHYQKVATKFATEQYKVYAAKAMKAYNKAYKTAVKTFNKFYKDMINEMEKAYNTFLTKYGDKTWEEVGNIIYKYGEAKYNEAKTMALSELQKLKDLLEKATTEAKKLYKKGTAEYEKAISTAEAKYAELKPKVVAMYKEYLAIIKESVQEMKKIAKIYYDDSKALYKQAEGKALAIYEANKNKTLKVIYNEASDMITDIVLTNFNMAKKQVEKRVAELKTEGLKQAEEMKVLADKYYKQVSVLAKTVIIPEIKAELISIINQSLRGSVELFNETVVAFYPHYVVVRDLIAESTEEIIAKTSVMTIKAKVALKARFQELVKQFKGLIERVKGSEYYKDLLNMKSLEQLRAKVEEMIKILKEKVEEVKKNPEFIKYKAAVEKKISELKDLVKKYTKNEKVVELLKVLKQVQKSSEFTAGKVSEIVKDYVNTYSGIAKAMSGMAVEEIKSVAVNFRSNPEETFWTVYGNAIDIAEMAAGVLKQYSLDDARAFTMDFYKKSLATLKSVLDEVTDDWTKATFKMIVNKTQKLINELEKQMDKLPEILKTKYSELAADAEVKYALYMKKANKWMRAQIAAMKTQVTELKELWEKSPLSAFVNNPIWAELADEVINHELVALLQDATRDLVDITKTNVLEFVRITKEEFNIKKAIIEKDLESLKINVEDLVKKVFAKVGDLKIKYSEMKVLTEMKVKDIIAKVDKFFEETRIVDIVEFVQEKTQEVTEYAKETQQKLMALKEKYTKMTMEMYAKYEAEAKKMYADYEAKAIQLYNEYYGQAVVIFKEYKAIVMPYYLKYKAEATKLYEEYYPIAVAKYEEMYKSAEVEYKKLMELYEKTSKDVIAMAKDFQSTAMKTLSSKLLNLKKMTIRQTIEELKVLPMKVVKSFNELYAKVEAELKKRYADAIKMYTKVYNEAIETITKKYNEIIVIVMPTYSQVKAVVDWTVTEISETGIFVYRYYLLADRYNDFVQFIDAEARRIAPIVKDAAVKYYKKYEAAATEATVKYFKQYYGDAADIAMDYVTKAQKYAAQTQKNAQKYARKAGHGMLRGIHSSLVYLDQMDTGKMKKNMKAKMDNILEAATAYFNALSTYIRFDAVNMEITISIPHRGLFKPSFSQTYKAVSKKVIQSVDAMKATATEQLELLMAKVNGLKLKMNELTDKATELQQEIMKKTENVRRDIMLSFNANKQIAMHLYKTAKVYGGQVYKDAIAMAKKMRKTAMEEYDNAKVQAIKLYGEAKADAELNLNKMKAIAADLYLKTVEMISEMYNDPMSFYYNAGRMMVQYRNKAMDAYTKYMPIAEARFNKMYKQMRSDMNNYWNTIKLEAMTIGNSLKPYRVSIEKAIRRLRNGIPARVAFEPLIKDARIMFKYYSALTMKTLIDLKNKVCSQDKKLCTLVSMSVKLHKMLYNKYTGHTTKMFEITKAEADKYVDMGKKIWLQYQSTLTMPAYKTVGMIFGKSHVLTFDGKFYDFINYKRPDCTYLLARDFADGKFTIMSQEKNLIFKNDELEIKINGDGTTKTTIGKNIISTLPIQAGDNFCTRDDIYITCYFNKKSIRIVVDVDNFFATIAMSAWDQGKSQGLLGSNDGESYNDWRLPNGKITKDIYKLANAYEMTGNKKCIATPEKFTTPACNKKPSPMCAKLFKNEQSVFAEAFKTINPEPFFKACESDTADCKSEITHCAVVAAFRKYAENKGIDTSVEGGIESCDDYTADKIVRKFNSEWTQTPLKRAVDIVVIMSERKSVNSVKNQFANLLREINRRMTRKQHYNVRYALIGFGGSGINEKAHIRPINGEIFGNAKPLSKLISKTKYTGNADNSNDAYHAILEASRLRFRPGASRVIFLFNTEAHTSHKDGPSLEETMTALTDVSNASLFVFDKVAFKNIKKNKIIGQTNRKIFTNSHTALPVNKLDMPASEFKELVVKSQGGLFANKLQKVPRIAHAVYSGVREWLNTDNQQCKKCVFDDVWPVCTSRADLSC